MTEPLTTPLDGTAPAPAVKFRDFTQENTKPQIRFRLAPDDFTANGAINVYVIQELSTAAAGLDSSGTSTDFADRMEALYKLFDLMLIPGDGDRFRERCASRDNPVDIGTLTEIVKWMLEAYTGRPTEPSSNSSDGQPTGDGGPSSTDGGSPQDSTPSPSPLPGS